jgi:hypothetical protein
MIGGAINGARHPPSIEAKFIARSNARDDTNRRFGSPQSGRLDQASSSQHAYRHGGCRNCDLRDLRGEIPIPRKSSPQAPTTILQAAEGQRLRSDIVASREQRRNNARWTEGNAPRGAINRGDGRRLLVPIVCRRIHKGKKVRTLLIVALSVAGTPPAHAYYCSEPSAPTCSRGYDAFVDESDFEFCKSRMRRYRSEVESFLECLRDAANTAESDYNEAVRRFNSKAGG